MPKTTKVNCRTSVYATATICPNTVYTKATVAEMMIVMLMSSSTITLKHVPEICII